MEEPTQIRNKERKCLSWRRVLKRGKSLNGKREIPSFPKKGIIASISSGNDFTSKPSVTHQTTTATQCVTSTRISWPSIPETCWPVTSPSSATSTAGGHVGWGEKGFIKSGGRHQAKKGVALGKWLCKNEFILLSQRPDVPHGHEHEEHGQILRVR